MIANHPELLALNAEAAAANKDSAAAARGWIPQLTLGAGWTGIDGGSESADGYIAIIGLSIPIFDRKQDEAEMADAQALVIQSRAEIAQAESKAVALASVAELVHLTAAATRFRQEAVHQSRSLVDTAKAGYAGDELGILELLDAYRVASEDTLFAIDLELTARNTSIELERLIGGSTR